MGKPAYHHNMHCGIDHPCGHRMNPGQPVALIGWPSCSFSPMSLIGCPVALPLPRARSLTGEHLRVFSSRFEWDGIRARMFF